MDGFDDYICEPLFAELARRMPDDEIMRSYVINKSGEYKFWDEQFSLWELDKQNDFLFWRDEYMGGTMEIDYKKKAKLLDKFKVWKSSNPDWEKKVEDMKTKQRQFWLDRVAKKQKERKEEEEIEEKARLQRIANADKIRTREQRKQQTFIAIVKYTKYIAYALGIGVLVLAGWGMYLLVDWIYNAVNWPAFWTTTLEVLKWGGLGLTAIAIVVGFIYGIVVICKKCTISIGDIPGMRSLGKRISVPFVWFGTKCFMPFAEVFVFRFCPWIGSGFKFLWMYVMTLKENNCPGIIWEEEKKI
jgi:hypothetical protein